MPISVHDKIDIYTPDVIEREYMIFGVSLNRELCEDLYLQGYVCCNHNLSSCVSSTSNNTTVLVLAGALAILSACSTTMPQLMFTSVMTVFMLLIFVGLIALSHTSTCMLYPTDIHKTVESLKWCIDNMGCKNVVVYGQGWGAHIATLIATNRYFLSDSKCIKACIGIDGFYSDKRLPVDILHTSFGARSEYYDAFPLYNVSATTPPHLLVHSRPDPSGFDYHFELMQKGIFVKTVYLKEKHEKVSQLVTTFLESIQES